MPTAEAATQAPRAPVTHANGELVFDSEQATGDATPTGDKDPVAKIDLALLLSPTVTASVAWRSDSTLISSRNPRLSSRTWPFGRIRGAPAAS